MSHVKTQKCASITHTKRENGRKRIAICGAGIAGLTLAGIVSRRLQDEVRLSVFERAPVDRDQGYGLDLDKNGQEALARAGVYHRYWEISRPHSDSMALFPLKGSETLGVLFRRARMRRWLPSLFAARPETNRGALRDVLLEGVSKNKNTDVHFDTLVHDLIKTSGGIKLVSREDKPLGEYDLVVDAMGLHSPLRHYRVVDVEGGKQRTGAILIHGVINDPDASDGPELKSRLQKFGSITAVGRGYIVAMQRFGAGSEDNRTSFFYLLHHLSSESELFADIGIEPPDSRDTGIMRDERLDQVKRWVKADMGDHFDPVWHSAVDSLDRVTIRDEITHGKTSLRKNTTMPIVCIGDSLQHCGLGGGGNLAMRDALELSKLLEKSAAFDDNRKPSLKMLHQAEVKMLRRKHEFARDKHRLFGVYQQRVSALSRGVGSLEDWMQPGWALTLAKPALAAFGSYTRRAYRQEVGTHGFLTCDENTPIFPNVKSLLKKEEGKSES